jgi:hypothetical protein
MKGIRESPRALRAAFYVIAIALVFAVGLAQTHLIGTYADPWIDTLDQLQAKQLDALLDMNRLLTTLGTTLLAATGFILMNGSKRRVHRELWAALASGVCVAFSLYFGYLVYLGILWMLREHFFNLSNPHILWPRQAHFYAFLLGVVFFADFAFHYLLEEDEQ